MRERHTFLHAEGEAPDPSTFIIDAKGISGRGLNSVREERFSFTVDELPSEINQVLQNYAGVVVRWTSPLAYETLEPFSSRVSPGLHIAYQPANEADWDPTKICWWLRKFGDHIQCDSKKAFIKHDANLSGSASAQYLYTALEDLHDWIEFSRWNLCDEGDKICHHRHRDLYTASTFDVSYDGQAGTLKFAAFWPLRSHTLIAPFSDKRRVEVGVLGKDVPPQMKDHEIGLSGTLTVLGESEEPSPVLFSFAARHRTTEAKFSSKFLHPTGMHPTLQLNMTQHEAPTKAGQCIPYAHLTLPRFIFVDRYQLADELFLKSINLAALKYITLPVDLEAPAYTTESWGSVALFELVAPEQPVTGGKPWLAEIPLHLRYLEPSQTGEFRTELPYPVVFWACEDETLLPFDAPNPFERTRLGYDALFSATTSFWHMTPRPEIGPRTLSSITIPVLKNDAIPYVGVGTAAAVGLGLLWVLWKLGSVFMGGESKSPRGKEKKT